MIDYNLLYGTKDFFAPEALSPPPREAILWSPRIKNFHWRIHIITVRAAHYFLLCI